VEEVIPTLQQRCLRFHNQLPDTVDFLPSETAAPRETNGIELELRLAIVAFHVNARWFAPVAGEKEEPVRPNAEYARHVPTQSARNSNSSCVSFMA
jgi:hypothetical protein